MKNPTDAPRLGIALLASVAAGARGSQAEDFTPDLLLTDKKLPEHAVHRQSAGEVVSEGRLHQRGGEVSDERQPGATAVSLIN